VEAVEAAAAVVAHLATLCHVESMDSENKLERVLRRQETSFQTTCFGLYP